MQQRMTGSRVAEEATGTFFLSFVREFGLRLRADVLLYGLICAYAAAGIALLWSSGKLAMESYSVYFVQWPKMFLLIMPMLAIVFDSIMLVHRFNNRRRLVFRRGFSPRRVASLLAGMLLMIGLMFFQGTFTSIKNMLPILWGGFPYDHAQATIDAWLHFGKDPWRWLHAIGGYHWVLAVVEFNYNVLWFVICFGALFFVATSPAADRVRRRYFLLFLFVWVTCGNVLAGIFLSAGPVFYGAVSGDQGRYAELSAFLSTSHSGNSAATYQTYLWDLYVKGLPGFGGGISAFPSVHVGLITLNALFAYEYSRRLGALAFAYVAFVLASSVYLGWHYAIDGYVSIIVVLLGYRIASAIGRRPANTLRPAVAVPSAGGGILSGSAPAPIQNSAG